MTQEHTHLNENNSDYRVPFGDAEVCFSTLTASPINVPDNSIYVPKDPIYVPDDFATIQDAVDAAYLNDTIIVREGHYIENVDVYKCLTIRSENGSDSTIVRAEEPYSVFYVHADYVNISGFTVEGEASILSGGIHLNAEYCNISNNKCRNNVLANIFISGSNNKLKSNVMVNNGICWGIGNEIDTSNTVNGKPVYYWANVNGGKVPDGAGQVIIVNCSNVIVENQYLNNACIGIQIALSSNITVKNNTCSSNSKCGIHFLWYSSNNFICLNNFINNTDNVHSYKSSSLWNSTKEITYTYNGTTCESYLGNFWDDYTGTDADGDGIGDTPYSINGDSDNYPLMAPWENYFA